mgnify:CR=1 FL=1
MLDINAIGTLIQNVGVSAVVIIASFWFIKYMFDKFMNMLDLERASHTEEMNVVKDAINNNTVALTTLTERLGRQ